MVAANAQTPPAAPRPQTERFLVNAAVSGVVRSNLKDLGRASVQCLELPNHKFRVRAGGSVSNPEKKKAYKFAVDMTFSLAGRRFSIVSSGNRYNADAQEFRDRVERVVPFLHLVKSLPVPSTADEPSRSFLAPHGYFVLRYRRTERQVEVSLHQDDSLVARFFLSDGFGRPNILEKFLIPANPEVTINFYRNTEQGL